MTRTLASLADIDRLADALDAEDAAADQWDDGTDLARQECGR